MSSIQATVNMALELKSANATQNEQMSLLKNVLDSKKQQMTQLLDAAPKLERLGPVGTRVNTTA